MTVAPQADPGFAFAGLATPDAVPAQAPAAHQASAPPPDPLGALAILAGTWKGQGFNAIWRPHHPAAQQDRFLELNLTDETLVFTKINGPIPNRGLAMPDIDMFGLTYMQQISGLVSKAGLHIEPGIWANVPQTADPNEPATVVRMASIPHGTVILAQGVSQVLAGGRRPSPTTTSCRFSLAARRRQQRLQLSRADVPRTQPIDSDRLPVRRARDHASDGQEPEQRHPTGTRSLTCRHEHEEPNLPARLNHAGEPGSRWRRDGQHGLPGHELQPAGWQCQATEVEAIFWIETIAGTGGNPDKLQLQYTQRVQLDFNGIHWPHVTVATLQKQ